MAETRGGLRAVRRVLAAVVVTVLPATNVLAQEPAVEALVGWAGLVDEATDHRVVVGGLARVPVTGRVSVGPEVVYFAASAYPRYLMVTGNVTVDLRPPAAGRRKMIPYLVAGVGVFQTRDRFPSGPFTATDAAFTAGGGARIPLSETLYLAPELRVGWELHLRATVALGVSLGR